MFATAVGRARAMPDHETYIKQSVISQCPPLAG
jgi:hypothetical protein